jgi:hypothetical protein
MSWNEAWTGTNQIRRPQYRPQAQSVARICEFWQTIPGRPILSDGAEFERRIVAKLAMSKNTARQYLELLSDNLD